MASLDTNCLLRWFLGDVPEQQGRVEALLATGDPLVVDDAALIECVFALEYRAKLSRATIKAYLTTAMGYPLVLNRTLWVPVLDTWVSHPKLSVVDVYLALKSKANGRAPLYTFDEKLANQVPSAQLVP